MKFPNYLLNFFAILGVVFVIFLSCSVASEDSVSNTENESNTTTAGIGKYQMDPAGTTRTLYILDTETGTVQEFKRESTTSDYELIRTFETQP